MNILRHLGFVDEIGLLENTVEGIKRDTYRVKLVRWVLLVAVSVRSGKIMPIQIVRFIETVYAFIVSFRTSYMWYIITLLVVHHFLLLIVSF